MCWDFAATFVADLSAPAAARSAVADALTTRFRGDADATIVSDARLVVSELVTAAVSGGSRSLEVSAHVHHGELWLEVLRDGATDPETVLETAEGSPAPGGSDASVGQSATLLAALTAIRGETRAARGTVVWTMIETPLTLTNSLGCELAPRSAILATAS